MKGNSTRRPWHACVQWLVRGLSCMSVCPSPAHARVSSPSFLQNLLRHRVESPVARVAGLAGVGSPPFSTYGQPMGPSEHLAVDSPGCPEPPFPLGLSGPRSTRFFPPVHARAPRACLHTARPHMCTHVFTLAREQHVFGAVAHTSHGLWHRGYTQHTCWRRAGHISLCTPSPCFPAPSVRVPPLCPPLQCVQVCMSSRVSTHLHVCTYFFNAHIHRIYSGPTKVLYNQEFI